MPEQQEQNSSDEIMDVGGNAGAILQAMVERIERMQVEIDSCKEDQKEIYMEAKSKGFDVKIIRKAVARRKMDREKVEEEDQLLEIYETALNKSLVNMME